MSPQPGKALLHYRLVDKIGEGGMGVVWKAVDTTLDLATMKSRRLTRLDSMATMRTFDITPDGKRIVFDRLSEDSDIVLIELAGPERE